MDRTLRAVAHARSAFADLRIDAEEDRVVRAVLVGMLREAERSIRRSTRGRSPAD